MKIRSAVPGVLAALLAAGIGAAPLPAQDLEEARRRAEEILGRPLSDQEILRLLQQSGLTPDEIRARLAREGLPPEAADPYLDVLEGRSDGVPAGTSPLPLVQVLTGVRLADTLLAPRPPGALPPPERGLDTLTARAPPGLPVFGRDLFARATSEFAAPAMGPVPPDYRIGPGDEIVLVLTGDVELAYRLAVSREGWIVIPDVGRVVVNGETLASLERGLRERLSRVYSGLTGDAEATTFLDVSLGALRTNQIFVIGEVERPAAYDLSGLTTALGALYWAGGPSEIGSFRRVAVNRGGRTVSTIDLYDYLLLGRAADVRLEHGDAVFVPVVERQVEVDGAVNRPGRYELLEGEGLRNAIRFAGGLAPDAEVARVQIERILPPAEREPGPQRVLLDVPLGDLAAEGPVTPLRDGDRVLVFALPRELRNTVRVSGGVWRPGEYGVEPGLRLWDLIERAGGLLPDVYEGRAQIQRLLPDRTRSLIPVRLDREPDGVPVENPEIEPLDQVFVFARRNLREEPTVTIGGWVRAPGEYPYSEGMTVRDLILRAGGLKTGGFVDRADVARLTIEPERGDTITRYLSVPLDTALVFDAVGAARGGRGRAEGGEGAAPAADDLPLRPLDAVYVRRHPGFEPQRTVVVSGEVMFPGPYSLATRGERLADLIRRAGGLTAEAYAEGLELWRVQPEGVPDVRRSAELALALGDTALARRLRERAGDTVAAPAALGDAAFGVAPGAAAPPPAAVPTDTGAAVAPVPAPAPPTDTVPPRLRVGVDLALALRDPTSRHNVLLQASDSLHVPSFVPTVTVRGRVAAPGPVLYRPGAGLGHYIEQAGGYARDADRKRAWVEYANGERATRGGKFLFFGGGTPDPDPGSVIFVPQRLPGEGGVDVIRLVSLLTSVATAAATIIIVANR